MQGGSETGARNVNFIRSIVIAAMAIGAAAGAATTGASAQNTQLSQAQAVIRSATAQWAIDLFSEHGLSAVLIEQTSEHDTLQVTSSTGGVFYVALRACEGTAPKRCEMLQTFALFDGAGVTLNQINTMVRDNFVLSYAFLKANGDGVIASKIFLTGGVTEDNVLTELAGYFHDLDKMIASIQSGTLAEVRFRSTDRRSGAFPSKILNVAGQEAELTVNAVGSGAPKFLPDDMKALID